MRRISFLLVLLLFSATVAISQSNRVSGIITDEKGQPVPGISIQIRGTKSGTISDGAGKYSLTIPVGATLMVTGVGFEPSMVKHNTGNALSISIKSASALMDDVVVTGVAQATSAKKVAFSITKVDQAKINTVPALDLSQTLRGKVAGITISQTQGDDGAQVFLRGAKSMFGNILPLIVIDGFVTNLALSDLNPQDVESIEVVKGAAASALYGTRAEGGVIQVVSKKGKNTRKGLEISLDNEYGVNNIQRTPELATMHYYKVNDLDPFGFQYAANTTTARIQNFQPNGFSVILSPYKNYYDNTKALLSNKAYYSNYVSLATSGEKYNAFVSFRNQNTGGVIEPMDPNNKKSVSFRAQFRPTNKLEAELSFNYFNEIKPSTAATSDGQGTFFAATLQWEPFVNLSAKNAAGNYNVRPDGWNIQGANLTNPLYEWSKREYTNNSDDYVGGAKVRYKILKNLSVEALGSIRKNTNTSSNGYPRGFETSTTNDQLNNGYLGLTYGSYQFLNGQASINYNTKIGKDFTLSATGKMVYESYFTKGFSVSGYDYSASVPIYTISNTRADTRTGTGSDLFTNKTVNYGYYLNGQTSWRDKIFLDALARVDQSSRYGTDEATAFFPRVALAYRVTQDIDLGKAVSDLKVRVNYGAAGSLPGYNLKNSLATISNTGISISRLENTELKRSITKEWEFGADASLYKKINVQFNYAMSRSEGDFILPPVFTPYQGSGVYQNFGVTKSNSIELEVNGNLVNNKNFAWDFGFTFGRVRSKIVKLGDGLLPFSDGLFRKDVGLSPFAMYGNKALTSLDELAVDNTSKFVTNASGGTHPLSDFVLNQKGFVVLASTVGTAAELPLFLQAKGTPITTAIGDVQPDFQVGFTNTFTLFKRFTLYATVDWKKGGQKYDNTTQYLSFDGRSAVWQEYASAGLPLGFLQTLYNGNSYSSFWVSNSGYFALREASLSYSIPSPKGGTIFKDARIAVIGRNLLTVTKFKGSNPEGSSEYFPYPVYRTFSARFTINF